jgi:predicted TPR repeat methyltransferase
MRYAQSADYVRAAIGEAGLTLVELTRASTRTENRVPVPGLLVLAHR